MKKVFPLKEPGKVDARVVEGVKNQVRKYVKRERRKPVPAGFDQWIFNCKAGPDRDSAVPCKLAELSPAIDRVVQAGGAEVYIEVIAEPALRASDNGPPAM